MDAPSPVFTPPGSPETLERLLLKSAELNIQIRRKYQAVKPSSETKYYTYVLMLQGGRIYVGNSDNIYTRLTEHFLQSTHSSNWVREHGPPLRVMEIVRNSCADDERYKTLEWCDLVGYEYVRGAAYCKMDSRGPPPPLATFNRDPGRTFEYLNREEIDDIVRTCKKLATQVLKP
jgi:hypothetical protein